MNLLLGNYTVGDYLPAGNQLFNPKLSNEWLIIFSRKKNPVVGEKMLFPVIFMHWAEETSMEILQNY